MPPLSNVHHVSEKNKQNYFCYSYVKLPPNLIIFDIVMTKIILLVFF